MIYIGTSGWMYGAWREGFYGKLPKRQWLSFASQRFGAVEVDATFYRQQKPETYERWANDVPEGFRFAVRVHRYLSHNKKLLGIDEAILRVKEQAEGLGKKQGPMLWQLPPFMGKNLDRIKEFGQTLRRKWPGALHALEFRNESWFADDVADILREFSIGNVISDSGSFPRWDAVTSNLVYVRLHSRPFTYASKYEDHELAQWADKAVEWDHAGKQVYVFFDNDAHGHAPHDAMRLIELVTQKRRLHRFAQPHKREHTVTSVRRDSLVQSRSRELPRTSFSREIPYATPVLARRFAGIGRRVEP